MLISGFAEDGDKMYQNIWCVYRTVERLFGVASLQQIDTLNITKSKKWVTYILQSSIACSMCFPFQVFVPVHPCNPTNWKYFDQYTLFHLTMKNESWRFKEFH